MKSILEVFSHEIERISKFESISRRNIFLKFASEPRVSYLTVSVSYSAG